MSNFKQIDYKRSTRTPVKSRLTKAQQWLDGHLQHLQQVEKCNQLIKEIFVCRKCGTKITNRYWVLTKDPQYPENYSKIRYYHSRRQCNPHFNKNCVYCGKDFRIKRKGQKLCSKKCSVNYMTSPILLRRCSSCGKEFKVRLIKNTQNNELCCSSCR